MSRRKLDIALAVGIAEGWVEALDDEEIIEAWQMLVTTGVAWKLQGSFGRMAKSLIEEGVVKV
jgi:hypothetical protein